MLKNYSPRAISATLISLLLFAILLSSCNFPTFNPSITPFSVSNDPPLDIKPVNVNGITPDAMKKYLEDRASPLAPYTETIFKACKEYNCDPCLIIAIANAESTMGKHMPDGSYNAWGYFYRGKFHYFQSWENAINAVAYEFGPKGTQYGKSRIEDLTWCAEGCEDWVPNVKAVYQDLAGQGCNADKLKYPQQ
jgi:hypothetical protein